MERHLVASRAIQTLAPKCGPWACSFLGADRNRSFLELFQTGNQQIPMGNENVQTPASKKDSLDLTTLRIHSCLINKQVRSEVTNCFMHFKLHSIFHLRPRVHPRLVSATNMDKPLSTTPSLSQQFRFPPLSALCLLIDGWLQCSPQIITEVLL